MMAKVTRRALVLSLFVLAGACGGSDAGSHAIGTGTLSGKIGGQAWSLESGETDAFLSMDDPDFFTSLYTEAVAPCNGDGFSVASNQLIVMVPMTPGDHEKSVTFVVNPQGTVKNLITTGHVVVAEVTATTVSGGIYAHYDGDNSVDGQFQATICAQ
jgi:hypothetical protein